MYDNNKGRKGNFIPMIWSFQRNPDKRIIRTHLASSYYSLLADGKGFEPLRHSHVKWFSRPPRYDRFDIHPYYCLFSTRALVGIVTIIYFLCPFVKGNKRFISNDLGPLVVKNPYFILKMLIATLRKRSESRENACFRLVFGKKGAARQNC